MSSQDCVNNNNNDTVRMAGMRVPWPGAAATACLVQLLAVITCHAQTVSSRNNVLKQPTNPPPPHSRCYALRDVSYCKEKQAGRGWKPASNFAIIGGLDECKQAARMVGVSSGVVANAREYAVTTWLRGDAMDRTCGCHLRASGTELVYNGGVCNEFWDTGDERAVCNAAEGGEQACAPAVPTPTPTPASTRRHCSDVVLVLDASSSITNREAGGRLLSFLFNKQYAANILRGIASEVQAGDVRAAVVVVSDRAKMELTFTDVADLVRSGGIEAAAQVPCTQQWPAWATPAEPRPTQRGHVRARFHACVQHCKAGERGPWTPALNLKAKGAHACLHACMCILGAHLLSSSDDTSLPVCLYPRPPRFAIDCGTRIR